MRFEYDKKLIGERLRFYRKKCNLTAEDVKEYLSLGSVQAIYKWENGTTIPAVDNFFALMELYGYEVKYLNRQVKRNINRFPEDFMFQLSESEFEDLRCQNGTANLNNMVRTMPYVFTEQGIYMLATVLRGELAEQQSIFIMRVFREMRHNIKQNQQFFTQSEVNCVSMKMSELTVEIADIKDWRRKTDKSIGNIQNKIEAISENFVSEKDWKEFVIYKNKKFEADVAYIDIYQQATKSIFVVDDYLNTKSLELLSQKREGVDVILFTENGHGRKGFSLWGIK